MNLKVTAEESKRQLRSIPHQTCFKAIDKHWLLNEDGTIKAQSVLWLFCWAKTGQSSDHARQVAARIFDNIMPISFEKLNMVLDHEYARKQRASKRNIEEEFDRLIRPVMSN
jgi:hypothetical protein